MTPEEYLEEPYPRTFIYDKDSNTWTGFILAFPGCIAQADSISETNRELDYAVISWIKASLDLGHKIPEPTPYNNPFR